MRFWRGTTLQYQRKPARCQRTTVSGVTTKSACFQPDQQRRTISQKSLSSNSSLGRGWRRFSTESCWRKGQVLKQQTFLRAKQANESSKRDPKESKHREDLYQNAGGDDDRYVIDSKARRSFGEQQPWARIRPERSGDQARNTSLDVGFPH